MLSPALAHAKRVENAAHDSGAARAEMSLKARTLMRAKHAARTYMTCRAHKAHKTSRERAGLQSSKPASLCDPELVGLLPA